MEDVIRDLTNLFDEARQKSEFEFVLALINYRGMGTEDVTNLYEWFDAIEFYKKLYFQFDGKETESEHCYILPSLKTVIFIT